MTRKSDSIAPPSLRDSSLVNLLCHRAQWHPDRAALSYHEEDGGVTTLSYAALMQRFTELSQRIADRGGSAGERALLLFPPGLEFVVAFLACQASRIVPVPTCYPKPGRAMPRLDAAAEDCKPNWLLADHVTLEGLDGERLSPAMRDLHRIASEPGSSLPTGNDPPAGLLSIQPSDLGFLQYTSGSTSAPKGVMVSHANLSANLESIRQAFGLPWSGSATDAFTHSVFWLPAFHDMGLIGGILESLFIGGHAELMSPRAFLSKPIRWLELISKTGASVSGAPNFAFELCIDRISSDQASQLDLSGWEIAFCGAEPISSETLDRFSQRFAVAGFQAESFLPCYGLAEATLLVACERSDAPHARLLVERDELSVGRVRLADTEHHRSSPHPSGSSPPDRGRSTRALVCCGHAATGTTIAIVAPESRQRCEADQVGEIWLQGASIAQGYWQRDEDNASSFHALLLGEEEAGEFLRTGDMGFLHDGKLYVTGRCKDVIIIRGRNHYPSDIESTLQRALGRDVVRCVAVATDAFVGDAMSLVVELSRHLDDRELPDVVRKIRRRIIGEHEIDARQIILARPGTIPVTTSGKVRRGACRGLLESERLVSRYQWSRPIVSDASYAAQLPALPERSSPGENAAKSIEAWLVSWLVARCGAEASEVTADTLITEHGLDSMSALELSGEIEDWLGVELTPMVAMTYPTPATLATYLAKQMAEQSGGLNGGESSTGLPLPCVEA